MTEQTRKDQRLTTADIVHGEHVREAGSPATPAPRGPAERVERPTDVRTTPRSSVERRDEHPIDARATAPRGPAETAAHQAGPLFSSDEARGFLSQWNSIQTAFVDEPRKSVEHADALVATTVKRLAEIFADERSKLEGQWDRGDRISTEDLRVALQRYRSFFTRLLSV